MDIPESEKIRQGRQLSDEVGDREQANETKRKQAIEETKNSILSQALSQDARARLNTIKISKPERAAMVENWICEMARRGQVVNKISDQELVQFLLSLNQQIAKPASTVKFDRRRAALDSDDDDYL